MSERAPFCMMCLVGANAVLKAGYSGLDPISVAQGVCSTTLTLVASYGLTAVRAALCEEHGHKKRVDDLIAVASKFDGRARA